MIKRYHMDCEEYLAVDVFKGLCSMKKTMVPADDEQCDDFIQAKKCRLCQHYTPTDEYLGLCLGKDIAYPDLLAKTCIDFQWKERG